MTTYTWEYGSEEFGLWFTIVYDDSTGEFAVTSLLGSFDLNALWFSNGDTTSDGYTLVKSDNSLNMNGTNTVWDDGTSSAETIVWDTYAKLSKPGGANVEDKIGFISEGETQTFTLAALGLTTFDPTAYDTLGVKATSVNGTGEIKWVNETPEVDQGGLPPIIIVSADETGAALSGSFFFSDSVSDDGRYVSFVGAIAGDSGVFWKDLQTGELKFLGDPVSALESSISGDGHYVAYWAQLGTTNSPYVALWDTTTGAVVQAPPGASFPYSHNFPDISDDGSLVAYSVVTQPTSKLVVWNPTNGAVTTVNDSLVGAHDPSISADGRYVAYRETAGAGQFRIAITEVATGTTEYVDTALKDLSPSISADGRYVAFMSTDINIENADVFLFDTLTDTLTPISADLPGENVLDSDDSISADGRYVVFANQSGDFPPSGQEGIYVWDRTSGDDPVLVSKTASGLSADGFYAEAAISADGRYISFASSTTDLIPESPDTGPAIHIYRAQNPLHEDFII